MADIFVQCCHKCHFYKIISHEGEIFDPKKYKQKQRKSHSHRALVDHYIIWPGTSYRIQNQAIDKAQNWKPIWTIVFKLGAKITSDSLGLFRVPQNFTSVVQVPCTLGCLVTCLVFSFTTFLPSEFLSLVAYWRTSSGSIFFTHTTLSLLFSVHWQRKLLQKNF